MNIKKCIVCFYYRCGCRFKDKVKFILKEMTFYFLITYFFTDIFYDVFRMQ